MKPLSHYMPKSSTQVQDDRTRMATRHGQRRFMMKPKGRESIRAGDLHVTRVERTRLHRTLRLLPIV